MTHINRLREQREKKQKKPQNQTKQKGKKENPRLQLLKTWLAPDMEH